MSSLVTPALQIAKSTSTQLLTNAIIKKKIPDLSDIKSSTTSAVKDLLISTVLNSIIPKSTARTLAAMPQKRRNGSRRRRFQRRRPRSATAKVERRYVQFSIPYSTAHGTKHRYLYVVNSSDIVLDFKNQYDDYKIVSLNLRYMPNESMSTEGISVNVLMDDDGFGDYGTATAASWFKSLSRFPNARFERRGQVITRLWRPVRSSDKDFISVSGPSRNFCTLYICNNGLETGNEVGGALIVRAKVLVRGRYYNANSIESLRLKAQNGSASEGEDGFVNAVLEDMQI